MALIQAYRLARFQRAIRAPRAWVAYRLPDGSVVYVSGNADPTKPSPVN
jgi:hypothetical protein